MVLVALIGVIALSWLALYYVVSIREANALATEAYRADVAGDYDVAIAQYSAALRKPLWNEQKALLYTSRVPSGSSPTPSRITLRLFASIPNSATPLLHADTHISSLANWTKHS